MTTLKDYPYWPAETFADVQRQLREITNVRKDDIAQFRNLPEIFVSGRTVGKIPASSTDVAASDRLGDRSNDDSFFYLLVDNAGTAEWRRVALGSF